MASAVRSALTVMMTSAVAPGLISMAVLLPREEQELQAHQDQQRLDHCQEDPVRHPVEQAPADPRAAEHTLPRTTPPVAASPLSSAYRVNTAPRVRCRASAQNDSLAMEALRRRP